MQGKFYSRESSLVHGISLLLYGFSWSRLPQVKKSHNPQLIFRDEMILFATGFLKKGKVLKFLKKLLVQVGMQLKHLAIY